MKTTDIISLLLSSLVLSASALDLREAEAFIHSLASNDERELWFWGNAEQSQRQCEAELLTCTSGGMDEIPYDRWMRTLSKLVEEEEVFGNVRTVVEEISQVDFANLFSFDAIDPVNAAGGLVDLQQVAQGIDDANIVVEAQPGSTANQLEQLTMLLNSIFDFLSMIFGEDVRFLADTITDLLMVSSGGIGPIASVLASGAKSLLVIIISRIAQGLYVKVTGGNAKKKREAYICMADLTQCEFNTIATDLVPMMIGEVFSTMDLPSTPADAAGGSP